MQGSSSALRKRNAPEAKAQAADGSASQEPNAEVALVGGGEDGVMPVGERSAAGDHPPLGVMADGLELPNAPVPFSPYPFEVPYVFPAIAEHAVNGVVETHEPESPHRHGLRRAHGPGRPHSPRKKLSPSRRRERGAYSRSRTPSGMRDSGS